MKTSEAGINWTWYYCDTKEEAEEYFKELTGADPKYDWLIQPEPDGRWSFRLHR